MEHYKTYSYCPRCDKHIWNVYSGIERWFWSWVHRRKHGE